MTPRAFGPGEWVIGLGAPDIPASEYAEVARPAVDGMSVARITEDWSVSVERVEQVLARTGPPEPDDAPVTTLARRLGHVHFHLAGEWEWTFGEQRREPKELVDTVGLSQYPYSDNSEYPFANVLAASSLEFIHHMCEIALLRDLWHNRFTASARQTRGGRP